ncbi:MAG: DUF1801 domain-containing protein [Bacteroidia bacterium]|jgi:hypothetical protein|nr:DUF1801 domain-containing protein [Bacteroidia bacterium]
MRYSDFETYASDLQPWMHTLFNEVRMLMSTFTEITEKMRYNTPFFDAGGKMMCYLGSFKKKRFVLAFVNGNLMKDEAGILKAEHNQTQVRHWEFFENRAYDTELLVEYIAEAIQLNLNLQEPQHVTTRKKGKR